MEGNGAFTASDPTLVFIATPQARAGLEIRVNFGVFAGREATSAEIDDLACSLLPEIGEVTIVAEHRHELSEEVEASLHQVRIEIGDERLPEAAGELETLSERLLGACDVWARRAIDARHVDI
jgi:hypothetical protein